MASKRVSATAGKGKATKKNSVKASRAAPTRQPKAGAAPKAHEAVPEPAQLSPEDFGEMLAVFAASINSPFTASLALQAYNLGLHLFIQGTNPGYPYPEMSRILTMLQRAIGDVARDGGEGGARHAKTFLQAMIKSAERYQKQRKPTHREAVMNALRSRGYALTHDGRREIQGPSYAFIAKAIFHNQRSRADIEQQVADLAEKLAAHFGPNGIDPESDLDEVARQAFKIAGINPHNALDANERMRAFRTRQQRRA